VWFFDLLTKELHHTKLSDWQISLVVIALERLIPPDEFVNLQAQAQSAVIAKLQELRNNYPQSDAIQAITTGLLDLINRTHIDPAPAKLDYELYRGLTDQMSLEEADKILAEASPVDLADAEAFLDEVKAKEAEVAQAAAEESQEVLETAPGPKRKKKGKHA